MRKKLNRLWHSKKGLAIPVTYLILFVSLITVISATYSYAVIQIGAKAASIKTSVAKQNIQLIDNAIHRVAWSFGASEIVYFDDCGGTFECAPTTKNLLVTLSDLQTFNDTLFNTSIGKISYELESSEPAYEGLFIRGDDRSIINQSAFTTTQLYGVTEDNAKRLVLGYRPFTTSSTSETLNGKPLNLIRINIINLNSSEDLWLKEKFRLTVISLNVTVTATEYDTNQSVTSIAVQAAIDGKASTVMLPISSNANGAILHVEVAVCNVKIGRNEV